VSWDTHFLITAVLVLAGLSAAAIVLLVNFILWVGRVMRIKLGRKEKLVLAFTGRTYCGCRYFHGFLMEPCDSHPPTPLVGRHRV
jgi:hypothetical protein